VKGSPFYTKTDCAKFLGINRGTVIIYLNSDKVYKYKWIFSTTILSSDEFSKWEIPQKIFEIITGELLGDGHIKYNPEHTPHADGRLQFTFSAKNLPYLNYLKFEALASICTKHEPTPWPNLKKTNIKPTQYWFSSRQLPFLSKIHNLWYTKINGKKKKILPQNIEKLLTPISIAHWIMGDGYFTYNTVQICTDNFSLKEVNKLIEVLYKKFGLVSNKRIRHNPNGNIVWRIRIEPDSLEKLKKLIIQHFIPEMLY